VTESGKQPDIEWTHFYFYRSLKNTFRFWVKCFARNSFSVCNTICEIYVKRHLQDSCFKTFLFTQDSSSTVCTHNTHTHIPMHSAKDGPSSFSLLSSFVEMSSPVHVPSSWVQTESLSFLSNLYLMNTRSWGSFIHSWIHLTVQHISHNDT